MSKFFQKNNPKRQRFVPEDKPDQSLLKGRAMADTAPPDPEEIKKRLLENLQQAIKLEHSTIPPYLCALYSIKDGTNEFAVNTIRSIVVEEMLHMVMAANILNAIGGQPVINTKDFIPGYPTKLPMIDESFIVNLGKFSKSSVDIFLQIEKSAEHPEHDGNDYHSIGEFYMAVRRDLIQLNELTNGEIFKGERQPQVTSEQYYGSGGKLIAVYKLEDALEAIDEIVGQGEGIDNTIDDPDQEMFGEDIEYAHYFRFNEIYHGQKYKPTDSVHDDPSGPPVNVDWDAVYNMQLNPKMSDLPEGSPVWQKMYDFNKTYMALLNNIHDACNGQPSLLITGVGLMYELKYKAIELMKTPLGDDGLMAGPSFEYVQ